MANRVLLGEVGIDSGQLLLINPCYIDGEEELDDLGKSGTYEECSRLTLSGQGGQLNYRLGHPGLGVVSRTGRGDGLYPVYAEMMDTGDGRLRVKRLVVEFIADEEH